MMKIACDLGVYLLRNFRHSALSDKFNCTTNTKSVTVKLLSEPLQCFRKALVFPMTVPAGFVNDSVFSGCLRG